MNIRGKPIGLDHPPYVIAEIGVNHDGSVERALELTRIAAKCGADAVKFQYFDADLLMSKASQLAAYQKAAGESDPREMLRRLQLSLDSMRAVVDEAHALDIAAIVTIFSTELVGACSALPWDAYKTASPDIIHRPLLDAVASIGRPLIVSTGASMLDEVTRAVGWLNESRTQQQLAALQCVSSYPIPLEHAALGGIRALARALPGIPIGYSDHTREEDTGAIAVSRGACILEKHITDDRTRQGPDHAASADPLGFELYVSLAKRVDVRNRIPIVPPRDLDAYYEAFKKGGTPQVERMLEAEYRDVKKEVLEQEHDVRRVSRQSIVLRADLPSPLPAGTRLERDHLRFARPGTGIEPWRIDEVVGRALAQDAHPDMPLTWEHLR